MTDVGSFSVQSEELREESQEWGTRVEALTAAKGLASNGLGQGYKFGFFANQAGLGDKHDQFIRKMVDALTYGEQTFDYLEAALASTANAYDGVDSTVAESVSDLKKRLPR